MKKRFVTNLANCIVPLSLLLLLIPLAGISQEAIPRNKDEFQTKGIDRAAVQKLLKKPHNVLLFEENKGQWHDAIRYQAMTLLSAIYLLKDGVNIEVLQDAEADKTQNSFVWNIQFVGMHPNANIVPEKNTAKRKRNYLRQEVYSRKSENYKEIWYENIYHLTDLRFYAKADASLSYDFIIYPKGDIDKIAIRLDGMKKIKIDKNGELMMKTPFGEWRKEKPYAYQVIDGIEKEIASAYTISPDGDLGFAILDSYDVDIPLIIAVEFLEDRIHTK